MLIARIQSAPIQPMTASLPSDLKKNGLAISKKKSPAMKENPSANFNDRD